MSLRRLSSAIALCGLLVVAWWLAGPAHAIQGTGFFCSRSAIFDQGVTPQNGVFRIITADGSANQIYVCGYIISLGNQAANVGFIYGSGPNCANSQPLTPIWQMQANELFADNSTGWRGITAPTGNDVCISIASQPARPVQAMIFYEVAP